MAQVRVSPDFSLRSSAQSCSLGDRRPCSDRKGRMLSSAVLVRSADGFPNVSPPYTAGQSFAATCPPRQQCGPPRGSRWLMRIQKMICTLTCGKRPDLGQWPRRLCEARL